MGARYPEKTAAHRDTSHPECNHCTPVLHREPIGHLGASWGTSHSSCDDFLSRSIHGTGRYCVVFVWHSQWSWGSLADRQYDFPGIWSGWQAFCSSWGALVLCDDGAVLRSCVHRRMVHPASSSEAPLYVQQGYGSSDIILQCSKLKNKPTIWGWYLPSIYGNIGDFLIIGFTTLTILIWLEMFLPSAYLIWSRWGCTRTVHSLAQCGLVATRWYE